MTEHEATDRIAFLRAACARFDAESKALEEIDRLRAELQNAYDRAKTLTEERDEAFDERNTALAERDEARRERDEARREVCEHIAKCLYPRTREVAEQRGWDCFKEER